MIFSTAYFTSWFNIMVVEVFQKYIKYSTFTY
jgi:hypothetical protein